MSDASAQWSLPCRLPELLSRDLLFCLRANHEKSGSRVKITPEIKSWAPARFHCCTTDSNLSSECTQLRTKIHLCSPESTFKWRSTSRFCGGILPEVHEHSSQCLSRTWWWSTNKNLASDTWTWDKAILPWGLASKKSTAACRNVRTNGFRQQHYNALTSQRCGSPICFGQPRLHCCVDLYPGSRKKIECLKRWECTCWQMSMCRWQVPKSNSFTDERNFLCAAPCAWPWEPQQLVQLFVFRVLGISRFSWYCVPSTRRRSRGYGYHKESLTADNQEKRVSGSSPVSWAKATSKTTI